MSYNMKSENGFIGTFEILRALDDVYPNKDGFKDYEIASALMKQYGLTAGEAVDLTTEFLSNMEVKGR